MIAGGRYTDGYILHTIKCFSRKLGDISCLVLTHYEGVKEWQRKAAIAEFEEDPRGSEITSFMGMRMYTVGFPDTSSLSTSVREVMQRGIDADKDITTSC